MKKAFRGLGIVEAGDQADRHPDDFYGSEDEAPATVALERWLLPHAAHNDDLTFWDPACGAGRIAKTLRRTTGRSVAATDLHDRGWDGAATGVDFLQTTETMPNTMIVSNPPFRLAREFIEHAQRLAPFGVAFLLKATYWQAARMLGLWHTHMPRFVLPLTWRVDFTGQGSPVMECAWFVWLSKAPGAGRICEYVPLAKPEEGA